jgi:hypothetical protein
MKSLVGGGYWSRSVDAGYFLVAFLVAGFLAGDRFGAFAFAFVTFPALGDAAALETFGGDAAAFATSGDAAAFVAFFGLAAPFFAFAIAAV